VQQEVLAPVDGRCRRDKRQWDNQPNKRHERGHWQQKQQQLQLRNNQLKRNGAKMYSSSQREVVAQRLTWQRRLCNGMTTTAVASIGSIVGTDVAAPLRQGSTT